MAHWLYPSTDRAAHENPKDIIPYHVILYNQDIVRDFLPDC
jgi:hypothetical protein